MRPDGSAVKDALPKDVGSIPRVHSKQQLTTLYNSSSREFDTLFWPLLTPMQMVHRHTYNQNTIYTKYKIKYFNIQII